MVWWLSWLPIGFFILKIIEVILGKETPRVGFYLFCFWGAVGVIFQARLRTLKCPRCRASAIRYAWFFMNAAECQNCGLALKDLTTRSKR